MTEAARGGVPSSFNLGLLVAWLVGWVVLLLALSGIVETTLLVYLSPVFAGLAVALLEEVRRVKAGGEVADE